MKPRNLIFAALIAGFAVPALSADKADAPAVAAEAAADPAYSMPFGPRGGPRWMTPEQREKLNAMTPEERQQFFAERRADCPRGKGGPVLTPEQRDKLRAMTPQERRAYIDGLLDAPAPTAPAAK